MACTQLQVIENGLNNDSERVVETYSRVFKERVLKGNISYALEPLLELIWNMLKRKPYEQFIVERISYLNGRLSSVIRVNTETSL